MAPAAEDTVTKDPKRYQALEFCGRVIAIDGANIHALTLSLRRLIQRQVSRP